MSPCHELAQLFTVPPSFIPPSAEEAWQALCGASRWDEVGMRPIPVHDAVLTDVLPALWLPGEPAG
jgi:hypothetical protein